MTTQHGDPQHDQQHEDERLTAYVLGVLDEQEAEAVDRRVASCETCRRELAELREMGHLLGEVPPEVFLDGPPEGGDLLLQRTLRRVREERADQDRRRWVTAGVAAAVVAAAVLGGGVLIGRDTNSSDDVALLPPGTSQAPNPSPPPAGTRSGSTTDPATGARMTVSVMPSIAWVRVSAAVTGIAAGEKCRLVVIGKDGTEEIAGSWQVSTAGAKAGTSVEGSALVAPADVASVAVENTQGKRFVTVPM